MRKWYVIHTKPRREREADEHLRRQGYEIYLPLIQLNKPRRGKWEHVIEPMFPRYLFIHIDPEQDNTAPIRSTRGVSELVRFGHRMIAIPSQVIEYLRMNEDPETEAYLYQPEYSRGDKVSVLTGPFSGLDGIYLAGKGEDRVMILVECLGRQNAITLKRESIRPGDD